MTEKSQIQRYHESFLDTFTRQTQWVEGTGLLLVTAMYLGGTGAAAFSVAAILGLQWGIVVGWFLGVVGKGFFHFIFLGRPARFVYAFRRPHSSWLSRGVWALLFFAIIGGLASVPAATATIPGFPEFVPTRLAGLLMPVSIALAVFLFIYDGFLVGAAKGIPFWSSGFMPMIFPAFAFLAGVALDGFLFVILGETSHPGYKTIHMIERVALLIASFVMAGALNSVRNSVEASKLAVDEMIKGFIAPTFLVGGVLLTIVLPVLSLVVDFLTIATVSVSTYVVVSFLAVLGDYFIKYSIFKAGILPPLIPRRS